jgi:hypothetical protein
MAGQWHGGKGSKPRPYSVPLEEFGDSHVRIFGEKKKYCDKCGKTFSWCQCETKLDELDQYRKQAQELWSDSCTTPRKK